MYQNYEHIAMIGFVLQNITNKNKMLDMRRKANENSETNIESTNQNHWQKKYGETSDPKSTNSHCKNTQSCIKHQKYSGKITKNMKQVSQEKFCWYKTLWLMTLLMILVCLILMLFVIFIIIWIFVFIVILSTPDH